MAKSTQLYDEFGGKLYPYSLTTLVLDEKGKMLETRLQAMERLLEWFEMDNEEGMIKVKYGLYSVGAITAGGKMSSSEGGTEIPETSVSSTLNGLTDVKLSGLADGHVLAYDDISGMWVNKTIAIGDKVTQTAIQDALGYLPMNPADFSKANIKSNLGISDWALSTSKPSYNKSDVGLGNVDNLAAEKYFTDLSSNATDAISATIGGVNKKITAGTLKSSLGLGSLAYKSSLVASDIPSLPWSKITSGTPTTLNGYGITDAYTITQINSKFDNTMLYSDRIDLASAYHHIGYGYTTSGWKTAGPAAVFGTSLYNLRMQLAISNIDIPCIYVSQMYNGEAKGWAELVTYEGAKARVFYASQYWIGDTVALHRSGEDTFLNYGNRATGNLYLYGTGIRFSTDAGASNPLKILGDGTVFIHDVALTKGTSGALKAAAYEALQYFADGKLIMHRNAGAENFFLNYGGAAEPMYLYGSAYTFHLGSSREKVFSIYANKDANFAANLTVAGTMLSKIFPQGKNFDQDPTSSFISTMFDTDAVGDSIFRIRVTRTGTEYDGICSPYSTMLVVKSTDTHGFISFGYNDAGRTRCYIGGGNADKINWSGILFHDNMHLIPKDDVAFSLGYSDKRWSALHAVSVFTDNIYGYIPEGGTYQRYRLVSSGDTMYLQVGAQDGTATTGKLTISGINVATLLSLTIYSQQTSFSGAVQVNGTSRFVSLATFDNGLKIGDATLTWDASVGMLKIDKGVYSIGAITAGGKGQSNKYRLDNWTEWDASDNKWQESSLSAKLGVDLHTRLLAIEESANLGPVKIDLEYIRNTTTLTPSQALTAGLTEDVINNMLAGKYTKVIPDNDEIEVWDYTAYSSGNSISIYLTQGDGFALKSGIVIHRNSITDNWNVTYDEI